MLLTEEIKRKLQDDLAQIEKIISELENFRECKMENVPENLRKTIADVPFLPQITSTGLESVNSVLDNLYICRFILKKRIAGEPLPDEEPFYNLPDKSEVKPVEVQESNGIKAIVEPNSVPQTNPIHLTPVGSAPQSNTAGPRPRARVTQPTDVVPSIQNTSSAAAPRPRPRQVPTSNLVPTQPSIIPQPQQVKPTEKPLINYQKYSQVSDLKPDNSPKKDKLDPFEK